MFRLATPQNTRRSRGEVGNLTSLAIPAKGINARDSLALMGPDNAISLVNVLCEAYGLRTRKGYSEWATNLPPLSPSGVMPVYTMMHWYPATAVVTPLTRAMTARSSMTRLMVAEPRSVTAAPVGKLFAARGGSLYDVTNGGVGPWTAQAGISAAGDFWTWLNFQNVAGSFLVVTNDAGKYAYYNGSTWTVPTMGTGAGQIDGVDPAKFCFVIEHKERLWFIEEQTAKAWYLPVGQITGIAKPFSFGEQFRHGGHLVALACWTVDGGVGVDDYLVAVGSQGDVALYKGTDPDSASAWAIQGVWHIGAL